MSGIEIVITPDQLDLEASMHIFLNYYKCQHIQLVKKKWHTNFMYSLQYTQFRAAMDILSIQPLGGSKQNFNIFLHILALKLLYLVTISGFETRKWDVSLCVG